MSTANQRMRLPLNGDCMINSNNISLEDLLKIAKNAFKERKLENVIVA